jgi:transcriptional regulator with XRE-family HTH domain
MKDTLLPETLLRIRAAHDLTQAQLARKLGVTQASISNWEGGVYPVPPTKAIQAKQLWPEECNEADASEEGR